MAELTGIGLYTPAEAGRLLHISPAKISRWLRGHQIRGKEYEPLWTPEVDLGDGKVFLAFSDLMEVRIADAFIRHGLSARRIRAAIKEARQALGRDHPLSSDRFRTDGREIFLSIIESDLAEGQPEKLLNLFRKQYEFKIVIDPLLKGVDFSSDGSPAAWWPGGRRLHVIVDPDRAFGAPIDPASSVPTAILANSARAFGVKDAARTYEVSEAAVRHAVEFEASMDAKLAA